MARVVCFGEVMMRLSPPGYERFVQAKSFNLQYGGAEANVAVSLANYGIEASYVTKLPAHAVGDACLNELRKYGVDVSGIVRGGDRLGIFFCEKGASMRPSNVIYDRAGSSIAQASPSDFDWTKILQGADWFHFTGITPALGANVAAICLKACETAKASGIPVSCDLNYRKKLWSRDKAGQVMAGLMPFVDLLIANEEDAADVFGIHAEGTSITDGRISEEGYRSVAKQLVERFGVRHAAITLRESLSASDNGWSGLLYDGNNFHTSRHYDIRLVDRVGGGDAFGAGLIYGFLNKLGIGESLEFAVAASALKQTVEGDFNMVSVREVELLAGGNASGRVQR
jgi:2-dehydro-3-deoxygluconokinase